MFSPSSFNHTSFSPTSFYGYQGTTKEARSGYWRLFFYQLQEKEIRERGEEKPQSLPKSRKKPPKRTTPTHTLRVNNSEVPDVPLLPIYRPPPPDKTLPIFILTLQLMSEIQGLYVPIRGRIETPTPVPILEDRKLRLLLLLGD